MSALAETVRQARPELVVPEAFAAALDARVASARAAWRDVKLDPVRFVTHLASRLEPPVASLDQLHVEDLYLACGCADGMPAAVDAFEKACGAGIDLAISAAGVGDAELAAIRGQVRERLLVKLAHYAGRGSLGSWVRIFAMREAQRVLAASPPR